MGRLSQLRPRITRLGGGLVRLAETRREVDQARNAQPWRGWYSTKDWKRLRWATFVRDCFTCQMCGRISAAPKLTADHRRPHRGDARLFWDPDNVQTLCTSPCHSSRKAREEARNWG